MYERAEGWSASKKINWQWEIWGGSNHREKLRNGGQCNKRFLGEKCHSSSSAS